MTDLHHRLSQTPWWEFVPLPKNLNIDLLRSLVVRIFSASSSIILLLVLSSKWDEGVVVSFFSWLSFCTVIAALLRMGSEQLLFYRARDGGPAAVLQLVAILIVSSLLIVAFTKEVLGYYLDIPVSTFVACILSISLGYWVAEYQKARLEHVKSQWFQTGFFYFVLLLVVVFVEWPSPIDAVMFSSVVVAACNLMLLRMGVSAASRVCFRELFSVRFALLNISSNTVGWGIVFVATTVLPLDQQFEMVWHLRLMALFFFVPVVINAKYAIDYSYRRKLPKALRSAFGLGVFFLLGMVLLPFVIRPFNGVVPSAMAAVTYGPPYYALLLAYFVNCIGSVLGAYGSLSGKVGVVSIVSLCQTVCIYSMALIGVYSAMEFSLFLLTLFLMKTLILRWVVNE